MLTREQQTHFERLIDVYNRCRGKRVYVPLSELVRCYQAESGEQNVETVRQLIQEFRNEYPQRVEFNKKRGVREAVIRIQS